LNTAILSGRDRVVSWIGFPENGCGSQATRKSVMTMAASPGLWNS